MPAARALALALSAALAAAATPASSAKAGSNTPALERFQAQQQVEQRVQDIGWRLVTGNSRFCDNVVPAIGLLLHDMASYREPAAVRNLLGLESDFAVLAAAEGSPAAKAGLAAGVEIAAIDNEVLSSWPSETHGDWRRTVRAHDLISARLATSGVVVLQRREGSRVKLAGEPACASRFEMGGGGKGASTNIGSAGTSRAPSVACCAVSIARGKVEESTVFAPCASAISPSGGRSSGCRPLSS